MNGHTVGAFIERPREAKRLPYKQTVIMFADRRYSASPTNRLRTGCGTLGRSSPTNNLEILSVDRAEIIVQPSNERFDLGSVCARMNGHIVGAIIDRPREAKRLPYKQTVIMFADRMYSASPTNRLRTNFAQKNKTTP